MQGTHGAATADLVQHLILFLWIRSNHLTDSDAPVFSLEISARKQGLPLEFCFALEQSLPEGSPLQPELEYYAVTEYRFPPYAMEMIITTRNSYCNTNYFNRETEKLTTHDITHIITCAREIFRKITNGELIRDFVLLIGLYQGVGFIGQTVIEAETQ